VQTPHSLVGPGCLQSECEFYSDFRSSAFRVVASQAWRRGQQVLINYGSGSNDALLQLYGFVEQGNRDDRWGRACFLTGWCVLAPALLESFQGLWYRDTAAFASFIAMTC
jgi:hypothetical protein